MNNPSKFIILLILIIILFFSPIIFTTTKIAGNYGDVYLHYYPLKYLISEQLINGKLPLWNPYIFAGQPLLANPQSAVFYPFTCIFYFLPLPTAFNYFIIIHFILAGVFFFCFLNSSNLSNTASLMGAMAYTFSSFLIYKVPAGHPVELSGYIWTPLILLFLNKLLESKNLIYVAFLSIILLFQFLSGHTFPIYISSIIIFVHLLYNRLKYWKAIILSSLLCVLLSSIQLIPTIELSKSLEIGNWPMLVKSYSLPVQNFINLILPNYFGNITEGSYIFQSNPSFFFERHAIYFGLLSFIFSLLGLIYAFNKKKYFYPLLVVIGIFISLGFYNPVYKLLYSCLPGLGFLRVPSRFYLISLIALIYLSSIFWHQFIKPKSITLKIVLISILTLDLFLWGSKFIYSEDLNLYRKNSEISSIVNPMYRIITQPETISANRSMLHHFFNVNGYEAIMLKDFSRYIGLQETKVLNNVGIARTDLYSPLSKGLSIGYEITTNKFINRKLIASLSNGLNIYAFQNSLPRLFLTKSVKLFKEAEKDVELSHTKLPPDEEVLVDSLPDNFSTKGSEGQLISFKCYQNKLEAEFVLQEPGTIVFTDIFYKGWRAWAKQSEYKVFRGNNSLRILHLPAGKYVGKDRIILYYDPKSFSFGLYLTLIGLLSIIIFAFRNLLFHEKIP